MTRHIPQRSLLLCALLLAAGPLSQATGQGVMLLDDHMSRCAIFQALSAQVPPDCRGHREKTIVFTNPSLPGRAERPCAFATTRIQFAFDSSVLTPESQPRLDTLAEVLKDVQLAEQAIRIEGHTDSVGSATYNRRLSYKRARAVQHYLHAYHGIALARLPAVGKGPDEPYNPKQPTAAINRRVQFVNLNARCGQS